MLRNYIKITLRNFRRNKMFTIINVLGLSIGVACCLLLALYIQDELSFDKHFDRVEDIYRITTFVQNDKGNQLTIASCSAPLAAEIKSRIPEIEAIMRILIPPGVEQNLIKLGNNRFYETNGYLADSTFFEVLKYDFIEGNSQHALKDANSVVISESLSEKLFAGEKALGKVIEIENGFSPIDFKVTGVIKEGENRSHLKINFLLPMHCEGWGKIVSEDIDSWAGQNMFFTYLRLIPGSNIPGVVSVINEILMERGGEEMQAIGIRKQHDLQRLADIHLYSDFDFIDLSAGGDIRKIYMLGTIALFILIIGCINFMNLATANANKRSKEVGIRKVMGAERTGLIGQFLGESTIIVLIAIVFSVLWVELLLPFFNDLTGKSLFFARENLVFFMIMLVITTLVTGIFSGSYPAFYLSSFQPASVLKSAKNFKGSYHFLRKYLVIFQFVVSITLVAVVVMINQQLSYIQSKDLGFDPAAKIVLPLRNSETRDSYEVLAQKLREKSFVSAVSGVDIIPGSRILDDKVLYTQGSNSENGILTKFNYVDHGYLEMMEMKLLAGRSFTNNRKLESGGKIIINVSCMEKLGFTLENAIGQELKYNWRDGVWNHEIIGVIADFHHWSLHLDIVPLAYAVHSNPAYNAIILKFSKGSGEQMITSAKEVWEATNLQTPFEYRFLNDHIQRQYDEDQATSSVIEYFTLLAIIISCLGLYGLSLYAAERRVKEIGIRKVMGATSPQIMQLLSNEFSKLTFIAFIVSIPVSYFAMTKWLENFTYKTDISIWIFVIAGLLAFAITQLTVSFQSLKAAMANPVDSLRVE